MAVLASLMGALPRRPARPRLQRPPTRLAVLTWTLSIAALGGAVASSFFGPDYGVSALVTTGTASAALTAGHDPKGADPVALQVDPTEFRRPAASADGRPRIAIIVRGLGLSKSTTARALADMPPDVTLALSAYGRDLQHDADAARADGHEVFLDVPVEPQGYPANDAGPEALLSSLGADENRERLKWALGRFVGFPGLVLAAGSPALDNPAIVTALLDDPSLKGLVWAYANAKGFADAKVEMTQAAVTIDGAAGPDDIGNALERLEAAARKGGSALAIVSPAPATLDRLKAWTSELDARGLALVPASALALSPAGDAQADPTHQAEDTHAAEAAGGDEAHGREEARESH